MNSNQCPICNGSRLYGFLHRERMPVHQNLVVDSREAAQSTVRGELDLVVCDDCGFVFNRQFDLSRLAYDEHYDNTQSCSAYFDAYLDDLVENLVERKGIRDCQIVEIGCGKGQFLRKLIEYPNCNNRGVGFDPSYVGPSSDLGGRMAFEQRYYDGSCSDVPADVVVCRHVIEHVPAPHLMLAAVRSALINVPGARVFFETPCVDWILENRVLWDFFYEHCSLFSAASLSLAFERAGFVVDRIEHNFGGQYLWLEARIGANGADATPESVRTPFLAREYGADESKLRRNWLGRVKELHSVGPIAIWGAGAKGATFANLVDPDGVWFECVVDLNPNKQGGYIPGTGHPIVAPAELHARRVRNVILMNPNYREENKKVIEELGIAVNLVEWLK